MFEAQRQIDDCIVGTTEESTVLVSLANDNHNLENLEPSPVELEPLCTEDILQELARIDQEDRSAENRRQVFLGLIREEIFEEMLSEKGRYFVPTADELLAIEEEVETILQRLLTNEGLPPEIRTLEQAIAHYRMRIRIKMANIVPFTLGGMI